MTVSPTNWFDFNYCYKYAQRPVNVQRREIFSEATMIQARSLDFHTSGAGEHVLGSILCPYPEPQELQVKPRVTR